MFKNKVKTISVIYERYIINIITEDKILTHINII